MSNENYKPITIKEARDLFLTHPARFVAQEITDLSYDNFSGELDDVYPYLSCGCLIVKCKSDWHIHALSDDADIISAVDVIKNHLGKGSRRIFAFPMEKIPPELEDKQRSYRFSRPYAPYEDDKIRPITKSDLPAVEECCAPDPEDNPFGADLAETFISRVRDYPEEADCTTLGLFEGGSLVGLAASEHLAELGISCIDVFVKRTCRRKGYAKRLLSAICAASRDTEYCYSCVGTNTASANTAKASGFVLRGAYMLIE